MKKFTISALLVVFAFATFGQNAIIHKNVLNQLVSTNTNVIQNTKDIQAVIWSDDFTTPANWTITNEVGNTDNWVIGTTGPSGSYAIAPIASTSGGNFALFDSDLMCSGNQVGNLTTTNNIDLTGHTDVTLNFEQYYRRFYDSTFVFVSTNGTTWTKFVVNASLAVNGSTANPLATSINISSAITASPSTVKIRFQFYSPSTLQSGHSGCCYAWMVDDVSISDVTATAPDLTVTAGETNGMTPLEHAMFAFGANVANSGLDLNSATNLNISVTPGTYTDAVAIPVPLAMSANVDVNSTNYFTATSLGSYTVTYAAPVAGDPTPANNTATTTFTVTDSTWAADDDTPIGAVGSNTVPITFGNLYAVLANDNITSVSVGFGTVSADLAFTISLYSVDPSTAEATLVYTTPSLTRTVAMSDILTTFNIVDQAVIPGLYFCAVDQLTATNIAVLYDASGSIYSLSGTAVGVIPGFGNPFVRMNNGLITNIKPVEFGKVSVYPNPSTGNLTIVNAPNSNIEVYNLVGELVFSQNSVMSKVDLSSLTNGSYIVKVTTKDGIYNKKINIVR